MPRANRTYVSGQVWHITHRCHQREFLLRFARDRRCWRHWVYVARARYGFCVLNYIVTSNHVHLLVRDRGGGEIHRSMQLISGRTAQQYNRRKGRRGAFWDDRYHSTAVQTGRHLFRCLTYIDLNMVRAGVVRHPREWQYSGYYELLNPPKRKQAIDVQALCELVDTRSLAELLSQRNGAIARDLHRTRWNPLWSTATAVGDKRYLVTFQESLGARGRHKRVQSSTHGDCLMEPRTAYSVPSRHTNAANNTGLGSICRHLKP